MKMIHTNKTLIFLEKLPTEKPETVFAIFRSLGKGVNVISYQQGLIDILWKV